MPFFLDGVAHVFVQADYGALLELLLGDEAVELGGEHCSVGVIAVGDDKLAALLLMLLPADHAQICQERRTNVSSRPQRHLLPLSTHALELPTREESARAPMTCTTGGEGSSSLDALACTFGRMPCVSMLSAISAPLLVSRLNPWPSLSRI